MIDAVLMLVVGAASYMGGRALAHREKSPKTVGGCCGGNFGRRVGGPGTSSDEIFTSAYEISNEPDLEAYMSEMTVGGVRISNDEAARIVAHGILNSWNEGLVDNLTWTTIPVNEYQIVVLDEPLSVKGLRLPTSANEAYEIAKSMKALPLTPVVSDARWNYSGTHKVEARPLGIANFNDPTQVIQYNALIGPKTGVLTDGYQKEVVLSSKLQPLGRGALAQYGFRKPGGATWEHGGPSNHDENYKDYSLLPTYMSRAATKNGVPVDLLNELTAGCSLGGPLPQWLVNKLS
jgi:hypothetical protein